VLIVGGTIREAEKVTEFYRVLELRVLHGIVPTNDVKWQIWRGCFDATRLHGTQGRTNAWLLLLTARM
jgi:hypothetical protein